MRPGMIAAALLALGGCGPQAEETSSRSAASTDLAAPPSLADLKPRELLLECAGAIAAHATLDPLAEPSLGTPEENAYFTVLALMDKEPDLKGLAGRRAAAVSRDTWLAREPGQLAVRAGQCLARFPG